MAINWKIITPALILLLLIAGIVYYQYQSAIKTSTTTIQMNENQEASLPKATGNIDDTVDALIQDSVNEQAILGTEDDVASIITDDSQAISDFGQSYNENEI